MGLESVVILVIVIAIVLTSVILVMREFKQVRNDIVYEESLSRSNEQVLNGNLASLQSATSKRFTTEAANTQTALRDMSTRFAASNDAIIKSTQSSFDLIGASNQHVTQEMNMFWNSDESYLFTKDLRFQDTDGVQFGGATYDQKNGIVLKNGSKIPDSFDLYAERIGANSISFASTEQSYLLSADSNGVFIDTPSMMPMEVRSQGEPMLQVSDFITSVNSPWLNINGFVTFSNNAAMGLDDAGQLNVVSGLNPEGTAGFILRDREMMPIFAVHENKVAAKSNICINDVCIGTSEWAKLKTLAGSNNNM